MMTPEDLYDLKRKVANEALRKWRAAHPLEEAMRAVKTRERREVERAFRDLRRAGA